VDVTSFHGNDMTAHRSTRSRGVGAAAIPQP
jgi:hypothetical protein